MAEIGRASQAGAPSTTIRVVERVSDFFVPQEEGGQMPELEEWLPEEMTFLGVR
jgi:hypothetical protein